MRNELVSCDLCGAEIPPHHYAIMRRVACHNSNLRIIFESIECDAVPAVQYTGNRVDVCKGCFQKFTGIKLNECDDPTR